MKKQFCWGIMLWAAFLIMLTSDIKKIKYLPNLIRELKKLTRKHSKYNEDSDYMLVPKPQPKEL